MKRLAPRRWRDDHGQLLLLVLAYTVIAGLLVTVVVDVSQVFLYRRSLSAAADAAALTAANQPDLARVYLGPGDVLPLSQRGATAAVAQYAVDASLAGRFDGFEVDRVDSDGAQVTVTLTAVAHLPFVSLLTARYAGGYTVTARASARSPLVP
jgi:uncharacterized membrane protein